MSTLIGSHGHPGYHLTNDSDQSASELIRASVRVLNVCVRRIIQSPTTHEMEVAHVIFKNEMVREMAIEEVLVHLVAVTFVVVKKIGTNGVQRKRQVVVRRAGRNPGPEAREQDGEVRAVGEPGESDPLHCETNEVEDRIPSPFVAVDVKHGVVGGVVDGDWS